MNIRILCLLMIVLLPSGLAQAQRRNDRDGFRQQYKLILERNIFSRDRRPYVPRERQTTYRPPPPIETDYCLKGIAREHEKLIAFIEQISTGIIDRYVLNARIAKGSIQTITLDMVEYALPTAVEPNAPNDPNKPSDPNNVSASGGIKVTQVRIGQTLQGLAPGSRAAPEPVVQDYSATPDAPASPGETPTDAEPAGDDESDILKRLMERRRQELGN